MIRYCDLHFTSITWSHASLDDLGVSALSGWPLNGKQPISLKSTYVQNGVNGFFDSPSLPEGKHREVQSTRNCHK